MSPGTPDPISTIEQLLRRHIGLEPETLGRDRIAQALDARQTSLGLDVFAYLHRLAESDEELRALVDEVVVPETWFFRDRAAFRHFRHQVRGSGMDRPLRVLSVPCCTGEEPYSIAMTLLDAGPGVGDFKVVAVDVSPAALATAAGGSYADMSFRERDPEFAALAERFCQREGDRIVVDEAVRDAVRFRRANLAAPHFLDTEPPFHAIFCRNLFIYLDPPARRTALAHLRRLLLPSGVVYFSAVEAGFLGDSGFRRMDEACPSAFALIPATEKLARASAPPRSERKPTAKGAVRPRTKHPDPSPIRAAVPAVARSVEGTAAALAKARQAADAGRLEEAASLCVALAAQGRPQADVLCLLGVVRQAQGDLREAERCFQRVLYLDPRHSEAVVHMALLARRRGEERLAENLLRRLDQG
jgi:chemotaxis protein methyltransferase WspC